MWSISTKVLDQQPPCCLWWFLGLRKCPFPVPKGPGSSWESLFFPEMHRAVDVYREGMTLVGIYWCLHVWRVGGFAKKAWCCRKGLDVFWWLLLVTVCITNFAEAEGSASARERHGRNCSVWHTDLPCCWFQALLCAVFPFLMNYLHLLLKSQMSRSHSTQTQPKLASFCSDWIYPLLFSN